MAKKVLGLILVLSFLSVSGAMAEELGPGCGLGKMIFDGKKGLISHLSGYSTNVTVGGGTGGIGVLVSMTMGTSGCDVDQVILKEKQQEVFVAVNLDNLSQEMAQGGGGYLDSLAGLMGCSGAAAGDFAGMTQQKYDVLFAGAHTGPVELLSGLKREMAAHPTLAAGCNGISS